MYRLRWYRRAFFRYRRLQSEYTERCDWLLL